MHTALPDGSTAQRSSRRYVNVRFPNWPIQRIRRVERELHQVEVVLCSEGGPRGPQVVAGSLGARESGITIGMPVAEARGYVRAEQTEFRTHDPQADLAALRRICHWCQQFTPLFGIDGRVDPDSLFLDLTGCLHLFESEEYLAQNIATGLADQGLVAFVAIADTIGSAWGITHYAIAEESRTHARIQHRRRGLRVYPATAEVSQAVRDQIRIIPSGEQAAAIDRLPVDALRVDSAVVRVLRQLGIQTIGRLRSLPRKDLPSRFGSEIITRIDQALGAADETFVPEHPPEPIEAEWTSEYPISHRSAIEAVFRELIEQVTARLQERHEGARELICRLHGPDDVSFGFNVGMLQPDNSSEHLFDLLRMRLESVSITGDVDRVRVRAVATALLAARQQTLFATDDDVSLEYGWLVNRLANRLGNDAVLRPHLEPDAQPERACRFEPLLSEQPGDQYVDSPTDLPERPLRLLPLAEQVTVNLESDRLAGFLWRNRRHEVARIDSPERIATGWWRQESVDRDYWIVETTTGDRFWLYLCRRTDEWFVHGQFD